MTNDKPNEIRWRTKTIFETIQDMQLEMNRKDRTSKKRLRPFCEQVIFETEQIDKQLQLLEEQYNALIELVKSHKAAKIDTQTLIILLRQLAY